MKKHSLKEICSTCVGRIRLWHLSHGLLPYPLCKLCFMGTLLGVLYSQGMQSSVQGSHPSQTHVAEVLFFLSVVRRLRSLKSLSSFVYEGKCYSRKSKLRILGTWSFLNQLTYSFHTRRGNLKRQGAITFHSAHCRAEMSLWDKETAYCSCPQFLCSDKEVLPGREAAYRMKMWGG